MLPAQKAWERQQVFIANASHEIRTPLTLLRATSEVALRRATDDRQKELLSGVLSETDYMARLVNDLLLLSRFDTGQLQLNLSKVNIADFIEEIVEAHGGSIIVKGKTGVGTNVKVSLPVQLKNVQSDIHNKKLN